MAASLAKKLRFGDVAYAIDTTPKSLRLWLQRDLVKLYTPKPETGWVEYSHFDIAILAIVRVLARWGISIQAASEVGNSVVRDVYPDVLTFENNKDVPAGVIGSMWHNVRLQLVHSGDELTLIHSSLWHSELGTKIDPSLPSGVAEIRREIEPAPVFLTIDVEAVIRTAFQRAAERAATETAKD